MCKTKITEVKYVRIEFFFKLIYDTRISQKKLYKNAPCQQYSIIVL